MVVFPNAKINLGLNVVSKRSDGYHDIETVFYPIRLQDVLEVVPAPGAVTRMTMSGMPVDGPEEQNLVLKAYRLLQPIYALPPIDVALFKAIPMGAGLGGGSSDAAFMLQTLVRLFQLPLTDDELATFAVRIGADCPFFLYNRPLLASGIGNEFSSIDVSLKGYTLVLVKPDIHVSTVEAYSRIVPHRPAVALSSIVGQEVTAWAGSLVNDFEASVFETYPVVGEIKRSLYELGAVYASMSGSGSAVYGLFPTPVDLDGRFDGMFVWQGECTV